MIQVGQSRSRWLLLVISVAGLVLGGCVTKTTTQSFRTVKDSEVQASYIAVDADFAKYYRLLGKDMGIYYPTGAPLSEDDLQRIRQIFRTAFLGELEQYTIVSDPAPDVLTVEASLIDMRSGTYTDVPKMRLEFRDLAKPGELVFLMELRDSKSDVVLGRAADSASTPSIATGDGRQTDWPAIEAAAQRWAGLFRQFLDQNLSQ